MGIANREEHHRYYGPTTASSYINYPRKSVWQPKNDKDAQATSKTYGYAIGKNLADSFHEAYV